MQKLLGDLIELNVRVADEFSRPALAQAHRSKLISLAGMVLGASIALTLGVFFSISITRPIVRIIKGLSEGAGEVAAASGQLSSTSQQLAEGASEQAASHRRDFLVSRTNVLDDQAERRACESGQQSHDEHPTGSFPRKRHNGPAHRLDD